MSSEEFFVDGALLVHRLHFAFTVTFHYLFPQLTMGLGLRRKDETCDPRPFNPPV